VEEDAKTYRGRAEQARLAARAASSPKQRVIFEKLAASYDALAQDAERLESQLTVSRMTPAESDGP
jgi:hypothetical protein